MPRTIPWLLEPAKSQPRKATAQPSRKRPPTSPVEDGDDTRDEEHSPTRRVRSRYVDEPPSSPPEIEPPLEVEYMQEGFDADDRYRMVEDELFATAKLFTRHLHADEYARHKRRALARGSETINNLQRPTDSRTPQSSEMKLQQKARAKRKTVNKAVSNLPTEGSEMGSDDARSTRDNDTQANPFAGFGRLENHNVDLSAAVKTKVNTRAAAGFRNSPKKAVELSIPQHVVLAREESDDLDEPVVHNLAETKQDGIPDHTESTISPPKFSLIGQNDRSFASRLIARRKAALADKTRAKEENRHRDGH